MRGRRLGSSQDDNRRSRVASAIVSQSQSLLQLQLYNCTIVTTAVWKKSPGQKSKFNKVRQWRHFRAAFVSCQMANMSFMSCPNPLAPRQSVGQLNEAPHGGQLTGWQAGRMAGQTRTHIRARSKEEGAQWGWPKRIYAVRHTHTLTHIESGSSVGQQPEGEGVSVSECVSASVLNIYWENHK